MPSPWDPPPKWPVKCGNIRKSIILCPPFDWLPSFKYYNSRIKILNTNAPSSLRSFSATEFILICSYFIDSILFSSSSYLPPPCHVCLLVLGCRGRRRLSKSLIVANSKSTLQRKWFSQRYHNSARSLAFLLPIDLIGQYKLINWNSNQLRLSSLLEGPLPVQHSTRACLPAESLFVHFDKRPTYVWQTSSSSCGGAPAEPLDEMGPEGLFWFINCLPAAAACLLTQSLTVYRQAFPSCCCCPTTSSQVVLLIGIYYLSTTPLHPRSHSSTTTIDRFLYSPTNYDYRWRYSRD